MSRSPQKYAFHHRTKMEILFLMSKIFVDVQNSFLTCNYNPNHSIWELYNVLVKVSFTLSKTKLDIQYNKPGIRIVLRVAERLKTQEIGKCQKNLWMETQPSAQSPLQKLNFGNSSQNVCKNSKFFQDWPILLDFFTFFQIFCLVL